MRYLWIEDFDGGKSGRTEIKAKLEKYFQIENKNINLCTLEKALEFLDDPENWEKFDVVLIDIRFKVAETEEREEKIYKSYFSSFLTNEKYKEYIYRIGGDVNSASAGVLIYLALVHKYNFNEERIAFISANVDNNSLDLAQINNMKELALKAKYESLNEKEKVYFSGLNNEVFEKYKEIKCLDEDEANELFVIPPSDKIDWSKPEVLYEQIEKVSKEIQCKIKSSVADKENLKYNSVKQEFERVGLKVPRAFEKPTGETKSEISWQFKTWVDGIDSDYYKLRAVILKSCLHVKELLNKGAVKYMPYRKMVRKYYSDKAGYTTEIENLSANMAVNMITKIVELFPINEWTKNNESFYTRVIKECVSLSDFIELKKGENEIREVGKETLKLVRNWTSHQGINNISSFDVAYVYMMMLRVFFYSDECMDDIASLENLLVELSTIESETLNYEEKDYDNIVECLENKARKIHKDAYRRFTRREDEKVIQKEKRRYRYDENAVMYDIVSGIGNQNSDVRDRVCMDYVYLVYLSRLKERKDRVYKCILKQIQGMDDSKL